MSQRAEPTVHERAAALADQISAELRRLKRWSDDPFDPARLDGMGPFGMRTLAPEEWIQHVLVPRVREIAAKLGELPRESQTAAWAARQFDGDPDAGTLVALLGELDDLAERSAPPAPQALLGAIRAGDRAGVLDLLARGADPNAAGDDGIEPIFVAAAAGHPALATFLTAPFEVELAALGRPVPRADDRAAIVEALLARGARPDRRVEPTGLTPLMTATFFDQRATAKLLRAAGAEPLERDAWGRTADRFAVYPTIARVIRLGRRLPMVKAAHVAQVHDPAAHQYTSPAVGLDLAAPLPADAFASWPADDPIVAFVLADDAVSRLVRLTRPVYTRLTLGGLVPGRRYRVLEAIQELQRGATVTFLRFDDIDNHYGRYEFETAGGQRVGVGGDYSTPENSPLAETHRYLEELD